MLGCTWGSADSKPQFALAGGQVQAAVHGVGRVVVPDHRVQGRRREDHVVGRIGAGGGVAQPQGPHAVGVLLERPP